VEKKGIQDGENQAGQEVGQLDFLQSQQLDANGHDPPLPILGAPLDLVGRDGGQVTGDFGWTLTVTNCTWHCTSW